MNINFYLDWQLMPEGHTIHRIARDHQRWFAGQRLRVSSPQGRFAAEAEQLNGRLLKRVTAHGKHLFYHWTRGQLVHVHLGLYGKVRVNKNPAADPRGAVRLRFIGSDRNMDLNGPNRCQLIDRNQFDRVVSKLGADPLGNGTGRDFAWQRVHRSRASIGGLLLNQSIIAGIGNVYRAEILYLMGIHPETPGNQLDRETFDQLWDLAVELLKIGVRYNRIITVTDDPKGKPPSRLRSTERLHIYKQTYCPGCGSPVKSWLLANRTMYACVRCQSKPRSNGG